MKKIINENNMAKIFHALAVILFGFLFIASIFITGNNGDDISYEFIIMERNSPAYIVLAVVFFLALMFVAGILYDKIFYKCNKNILLGMVCLISFLVSIYWIWGIAAVPQGDQALICQYASRFNQGDFSDLQRNCYITMCQQQLGLITFMRVLFYIFGDGNYMAYQYFSALMVVVIIFSGRQIVRKISCHSGKVEFYYLVLMGTFFPMYGYVPFVYGDLSSTAVVFLSGWLFLECLEEFSVPKVFALALTAGIAVQLRRNVLVILIAFIIVVAVKLIQQWNWKVLVTGCSILLGALLLQVGVKGIYHDVMDNEKKEIPAVLYIAMGLHDHNNRPGWFDAYNQLIFEQYEYDPVLASDAARADIQKSFEKFIEDPGYMVHFFGAKINSQWQAPMYQSVVINSKIVGDQSLIAHMIYNYNLSKLGRLLLLYTKAFQLFMYGCIFLWLIMRWKKKQPIENYLLLIAVFGGFLFSILWEAKARYVFPYALLMIPYFAVGLQELVGYLYKKIKMIATFL